jgi:hypothetical protein
MFPPPVGAQAHDLTRCRHWPCLGYLWVRVCMCMHASVRMCVLCVCALLPQTPPLAFCTPWGDSKCSCSAPHWTRRGASLALPQAPSPARLVGTCGVYGTTHTPMCTHALKAHTSAHITPGRNYPCFSCRRAPLHPCTLARWCTHTYAVLLLSLPRKQYLCLCSLPLGPLAHTVSGEAPCGSSAPLAALCGCPT